MTRVERIEMDFIREDQLNPCHLRSIPFTNQNNAKIYGIELQNPYICAIKSKQMHPKTSEIFDVNHSYIRAKDLGSRAQRYRLNQLIESGEIVKVKRGLYRRNDHPNLHQIAEVAQMIPRGIFCMYTAWRHYGLTTVNPAEYHVAIGQKEKIVLPDYPPVKLYYWVETSYQLGVSEVIEGQCHLKMYDLEKSVCDAVRFRNKIGMDTTTEILKNYVKQGNRDLDRLIKYASQLKIGSIIREYLTILV